MTANKTLVVDTNWKTVSAEVPAFVSMEITSELTDLVRKLQQLANEHDLSEVRSVYGYDWERVGDDTVILPEIVVTKFQFWFVGVMRYADQLFISESISTRNWDSLLEAFAAPDKDNLYLVTCFEEESTRETYLQSLAENLID